MLTGHRPFASTLPKLIRDQLETPPPPFAAKRPDLKVPPKVERLVLRCLEKDPARRPQSARELADAFREALNRPSLAAPVPHSDTPQVPLARRYRRWIALGALLLIGLASLLAALDQLLGLADRPAPTPASDMTARQSGTPPRVGPGSPFPRPSRSHGQLRAWARQGYRPDTAGGTSKGWPAILIRAEDGVRFHWSVGGIYLPNGYSPGSEADPVDGWPRFLVREDGVAFLRVGGGTFTMGCLDEAVIPADDPTRPAHPVSLSGFYMQKTEVTNGEIEPYIMSIGRGVCPGWEKRFERMMLELGAELARKHPAAGIPWTVARDYARKKLGRLPTEAQWEFAARSRGKEYHYVWDGRGERSEPLTQLANINNLGPNPFGTVAVGCYPIDVTEQGILDLTGNLREWCRDAWRPYERQAEPVIDPQFSPDLDGRAEVRIVVRGGSFQSSPDAGRTTSRAEPLGPGDSAVPTDVGFRLVIECPDRAPSSALSSDTSGTTCMSRTTSVAGLALAGLLPILGTASAEDRQARRRRAPEVWAVVVGIEQYNDPAISGCRGSIREGAEFAHWLTETARWDRRHILLMNERGTPVHGRPEDPVTILVPTRENLQMGAETVGRPSGPGRRRRGHLLRRPGGLNPRRRGAAADRCSGRRPGGHRLVARGGDRRTCSGRGLPGRLLARHLAAGRGQTVARVPTKPARRRPACSTGWSAGRA